MFFTELTMVQKELVTNTYLTTTKQLVLQRWIQLKVPIALQGAENVPFGPISSV